MEKLMRIGLMVVIVVILAAGCNMPTTVTDGGSAQVAQTFAAQTIEARLTENAANQGDGQQPPADTQAPPPPEPPDPTDTPEPSNTPKPTLSPTKETPCNMAKFVKDVTVPDGTEFSPGDTFTKTWRLKNVGSCTWNNDYDLVFDTGEKMGGSNVEDINMGGVPPGQEVDVSVDLTAPGSTGNYKGKWQLRSADGVVFGLGEDDVPFFVEIKVVADVSFQIQESHSYPCAGKKVFAFKVKNTGTKILTSMGGTYKNLSTDVQKSLVALESPFTENKGDCPLMHISDIEPGDVYWAHVTFVTVTSGTEFKFNVKLCTQPGLGGECASREKQVTAP